MKGIFRPTLPIFGDYINLLVFEEYNSSPISGEYVDLSSAKADRAKTSSPFRAGVPRPIAPNPLTEAGAPRPRFCISANPRPPLGESDEPRLKDVSPRAK